MGMRWRTLQPWDVGPVPVAPGCPSYDALVLADGATLYWKLDDAMGAVTAVDSSGHGNDGTYTPAFGSLYTTSPPYRVRAGPSNVASGFGYDLGPGPHGLPYTYIRNALSTFVTGYTAFSVEAWTKLYALRNGVLIFRDLKFVMFAGSGQWGWSTYDGSAWTVLFGGSAGLFGRHLVGTYDGATSKLYEDGHLVNSTPQVGVGMTNSDLYVGADPIDPYYGFASGIAIYPYALSAAQVLNHQNVGTCIEPG